MTMRVTRVSITWLVIVGVLFIVTDNKAFAQKKPEQLKAIQDCIKGLTEVIHVPAKDKAKTVAKACKDLSPHESCRLLLDSLNDIPITQRWAKTVDQCLIPWCKGFSGGKPKLCTTNPSEVAPMERDQLAQDFQQKWLKQKICTQLKKPKPEMCLVDSLPKNALENQKYLASLVGAAGRQDWIEKNDLIHHMGVWILILLFTDGEISAEVQPTQSSSTAVSLRDAWSIYIQLKDNQITTWVEGYDHKKWVLKNPIKVSDLDPMMNWLKQKGDKLEVRLHMSKDLPYSTVVVYMDALRKIGLENVMIGVRSD